MVFTVQQHPSLTFELGQTYSLGGVYQSKQNLLLEVVFITANQIEYAKLLETRRSNMAGEALTSERDRNTYAVNYATQQETARHNRATESAQLASLDETARANREREAQGRIGLDETKRSNLARERETQRSNIAREQETTRSNREKERETNRSNLVREAETERANRADYEVKSLQHEEAKRHNLSTEHQNAVKLTEEKRHNVRSEEINKANAYAAQTRAQAAMKQVGVSEKQLSETTRHNRWTEATNVGKVISDALNGMGRNLISGTTSLIGALKESSKNKAPIINVQGGSAISYGSSATATGGTAHSDAKSGGSSSISYGSSASSSSTTSSTSSSSGGSTYRSSTSSSSRTGGGGSSRGTGIGRY